MPTTPEYAQLANRVYGRTRENRTPVPTGWTELTWIPDPALSGFSAGVYQKGNEIVISYTGTNEGKAVDFLEANIPIGLGATSSQVVEAMKLYLTTKQLHQDATITFTGHSLGAGLASMMAVFFNKPAVIFDAAPFELGARNLLSLAHYRLMMAALGFSDPVFNAYASSIDFAEFSAREANVHAISLESEVLAGLRAIAPTIYGGIEQIEPIGPQTLLQGGIVANELARIELHSMTLLASVLTSPAFRQAIPLSSQALALFFDEDLYKTNPEKSNQANFLDRLYIAQVSNTQTPLLDRFAADLTSLNSGSASQSAIQRP